MTQGKTLNLVSTVDALTKTFAQEIINGEWEQGVQCKDTIIAEMYGVSRNSVREAFSILVEQGLLQKKTNKGFFVPVFSADDIRELYGARLVIELEAVECRARNREVPEGMYAAVDLLRSKTIEDFRSYVLEVDMRFHMELAKGLNNQRILRMLEKLFMEIQIINRQAHSFFPIEFTVKEHEKIIDAILEGDAANARQAMRDHLAVSIDRQIKELEGRTD